jgi:hypothetical protein
LKTDYLTCYRRLVTVEKVPVMVRIDDLFPINHPSLFSKNEENQNIFEKILENKKGLKFAGVPDDKVLDGMLLIFDQGNPESFDLLEKFLKFLTEKERLRMGLKTPKIPKKLLIGTKSDLKTSQVKPSDIERLKLTYSLDYLKTSSKTNKNIEKAFKNLITSIFSQKFSKLSKTTDFSFIETKKELSRRGPWYDCSIRGDTLQTCMII